MGGKIFYSPIYRKSDYPLLSLFIGDNMLMEPIREPRTPLKNKEKHFKHPAHRRGKRRTL
jgi:hypothetical protein